MGDLIMKQAQQLPEHIAQKIIRKELAIGKFPKEKNIFAEGGRNDNLFKLSCSLKRQDVSDMAIAEMLGLINERYCKPPLSPKELSLLLNSSKRYDKDALKEFSCMSEIESQQVSWFWYPYMPSGSIVFLDGHPGRGKSFFTMWLAALCSTGGNLPFSNEKIPKCRVLILNAEDDPERTMRPAI